MRFFLDFSHRRPPPISNHFVVNQEWSLTRELTVLGLGMKTRIGGLGGSQFNLPPTLFVNPTPKSSSDHLLILPVTQVRHVSKCAAVIEKVNYLKNCVCFYLYLVDIVEAVIMDTPLSCQLYLWLISVAEFFFFSHTCRLLFKTPLEFYAYT